MKSIEKSLIQQHYSVLNITYSSCDKNIDLLAQDIFEKIKKYANKENVTLHFVTHSMGGLTLRSLLAQHPINNVGRVIMLGPPNQGSQVADKFHKLFIYKCLFGPAGQELTTHQAKQYYFPIIKAEVGIIAANKSWDPISSFFLPRPHDGKVSVESTKIAEMKDHIVIDTSHVFMLFNAKVKYQINYFLKYGQFDHCISADK